MANFWATIEKNWATFHSNIWSYCNLHHCELKNKKI